MNNQKKFQEKIREYANAEIDAKKQKELNAPIENGLSEADTKYMQEILGMVDNGEINLNVPSSLLNQAEYEKISPEQKVKVEMRARIILQDLRQMKNLHDSPDYATESYQMETIIRQIKRSVEALENMEGDVLKI